MTTLFSIGHSNHTMARFLALLESAGVTRLADVRSVPYSRRLPHFRREPLARALEQAGIHYVFLGETLGGRPAGPWLDAQGRLDVSRRAAAGDFLTGIDTLIHLAAAAPTAMMCAEEDPQRCHRRHLVAPVVVARGVAVVHLRGDGGRQSEAGSVQQMTLL